jgi:hypothetical protein
MLFLPPQRLDMPLWRYVSFARFVSMLQTKSLPMVPAALMEDRFEGSFPQMNNPDNRVTRALAAGGTQPTPSQRRVLEDDLLRISRRLRDGVLLSCWHANETESVAMWKLYAQDAICLMSDYRSLCQVLHAPTEPSDDYPEGGFRVGQVAYINYRMESIDNPHYLAAYMHKRREFAHEREVRAVYVERTPPERPVTKLVPIVLRDLVHGVVLAPGTQRWFMDCVAGLLDKYDLDVPINMSALDGPVIP